MSQPIVTVRPLTRADLAAITPWFEDPDTRRSLGGPDWPAAMLDHAERAIGDTFRGAVQTAAHHYLAQIDGRAVGYIDCGTLTAPPSTAERGPTGRSSPSRSRWRPGRSRSPSTRRFVAAELAA